MSKMKDLYQEVTEPNYEAYAEYQEQERDVLRKEGAWEALRDLGYALEQAKIRYAGTELVAGLVYALELANRQKV